MTKTTHIRKTLDRLAAAETDFLNQEFFAPVLCGGEVRVRIANVVCRLRIEPADFEGWGVFRPSDHSSARLIREAGLTERRRYLDLLPLARMILCRRKDNTWQAIAAQQANARLQVDGLVPLRLLDGGQLFDVVRTRFDGANFWFEAIDPRHDPATAAFLRQSLERLIDPEKLERRGLLPEDRAAYALNYFAHKEVRKQIEVDQVEVRLRRALAHAGAKFVGYVEHRDGFRVTYTIGRRQHVSSVNKKDLTVQVAGICLSGEDRKFDLGSLVSVLQQSGGHTVRVGRDNQGMTEEEYWRVHPPRL